MTLYKQIEEISEIRRLNKELAIRLKRTLLYSEDRIVGYPQGNFPAHVRFRSATPKEAFWWVGDPATGGNFVGRGTPNDTSSLNIDVQFNFPIKDFNRRQGGAFLRDVHTDEIILAHSGIVTLGRSRIRKEDLFLEVSASKIAAATSSGIRDFLFVGRLESRSIAREIEEFSTDLRDKLREMNSHRKNTLRPKQEGKSDARPRKFSELKDYFDEFSGQRKLDKRPKSIAECYHGDIIKCLRKLLPKDIEPQKSVEIDLFAKRGSRAFLFEAKTSNNSQSIFTATGQLEVLSRSVLRRSKNDKITKIMVLPEKPHPDFAEILSNKMGIKILVFHRSSGGSITIPNLSSIFR